MMQNRLTVALVEQREKQSQVVKTDCKVREFHSQMIRQ